MQDRSRGMEGTKVRHPKELTAVNDLKSSGVSSLRSFAGV